MDFLKKAQESIKNNKKIETNVGNGTNPFLKNKEESSENKTSKIPTGLPGKLPGKIPNKVPGKMPGKLPNLPGKPNLPNISKNTADENKNEQDLAKNLVKENKEFNLEKAKNKEDELNVKIQKEEVQESIKNVIEEDIKETVKEEKKEEKKEEIKEEESSKTKGKNRKKNAKAKETEIEDFSAIDIPSTELSFEDAIISIKSSFVDADWEEYKKSVIEQIQSIVITEDMNSVTCKETLASLGRIREDVWQKFSETKTLFENLSNEKPEGLIERIKKINCSGTNDAERKRNSVLAVMTYKNPDNKLINLFEILDETRARYNFLKGIMDSIQYKTSTLITYLGNLKLENRQG